MTATPTTKTVHLRIPLSVASNGSTDTKDSLTVRQPRTKHVKQLAALIGSDLVDAMFSVEGDKEKMGEMLGKAIPNLLTADNLDATSAILADLAGISAPEFDELHPLDAMDIVKAAVGFFPALRSTAPTSSPPTSPSTTTAH